MSTPSPSRPRVFIAIAVLAVPVTAHADVLSINDAQDAMIFGAPPVGGSTNASQYTDTTMASGAGPAMFAGADGSGNIKRFLIQFDLSSIPAGSTITSATLTLHLAQVAGSGGSGGISADRLFGLYDNLQAWTEGPSARTTAAGVGGTGQGKPRQIGDVTWDYASFNTNSSLAVLWNSGNSHGGNFSSTESDQLDVPSTTALGVGDAFIFASSSGLVADLQNWLDDPSSNDGWMLKSDNLELTATSFIGFWTRDALGEGNTTAVAPFITVTYTPPAGALPEPASLGLLAVAVPAMLIRRRQNSRSKTA